MLKFEGKEYINTLLNIDNFFGEHQGSMKKVLVFFAVAAAPVLGWLFFLIVFMPFKWFLVFWIPWTLRWALYILGNEPAKMAQYRQQKEDAYKSAEEIVHIAHIHDDGLIEYQNDIVAYILSGFPKGYLNDAKLSIDFEEFMDELDRWDWDYALHNVIDELPTQNMLPNLVGYKDKEVIQDRIDFYSYQDDFTRSHTGLYRFNFIVMCSKYDWKKMKQHMEELVSSRVCACFNEIKICNAYEVDAICNRDICGFVSLDKMLTKKYDNNDFKGSKVLWYDNEVPEELKPKKKYTGLEERRVSKQ